MKRFTIMIRMALESAFIFSFVSCTSTATIKAVNSKGEINTDVKIYVDGKYLGDGEVQYSDSKTVYSAIPFLELRKEGCKTQREKLDIKTNWVNSLSGVVLMGAGMSIMSVGRYENPETNAMIGLPLAFAGLVPLFWTRSYTSPQTLQFQCLKVSEE